MHLILIKSGVETGFSLIEGKFGYVFFIHKNIILQIYKEGYVTRILRFLVILC